MVDLDDAKRTGKRTSQPLLTPVPPVALVNVDALREYPVHPICLGLMFFCCKHLRHAQMLPSSLVWFFFEKYLDRHLRRCQC